MRLHNFTLLQKIGEGAYAVVWKAHDLVGSRDVAIKVFRIPSFDERNRREAATRFVSGTMAMRRLENEPTVIKIFEGPHVTGCHLWFAMEYAEDGSLYQALASNSLTISDKFFVVDDLCQAIQAAHKGGIRHRDIRPRNILLRRSDGRLRALLADFDISYFDFVLIEGKSTAATLGVHRYLPLEVLDAAGVDLKELMRRYQNDIYALIIVVFDLFAGQGMSLPRERSARAFLAAIPKKTDKEDSEVDTRTRRTLANFLHMGLGRNDKRRFDSIQQAKYWWSSVKGPATAASSAPILGYFSVFASILILFDWAMGQFADHSIPRIIAAISGGTVSLAMIVALIVSIRSRATLTFPKWRLMLKRTVEARPLVSWLVVTCLALLVPVLLLITHANWRAGTYWVKGGKGCYPIGITGQHGKTMADNLPTPIWFSGDFRAIACPKGSPVSDIPMSWAAGRLNYQWVDLPPEAPKPSPVGPKENSPPFKVGLNGVLLSEEAVEDMLKRLAVRPEIRILLEGLPNLLPPPITLFPTDLSWKNSVLVERQEDLKPAFAAVKALGMSSRKDSIDNTLIRILNAHLMALAFQCHDSMNLYVQTWRLAQFERLFGVWATDIARCLARPLVLNDVIEAIFQPEIDVRERAAVGAVVVDVIAKARHPSLLRKQSVMFMERLGLDWSTERNSYVSRILDWSTACDEIELVVTKMLTAGALAADADTVSRVSRLHSRLRRKHVTCPLLESWLVATVPRVHE